MTQYGNRKINDIMLPSPSERQQLFYLLKKLSSLTAWQRILGFYNAWADATENSVREADDRGWTNETSLSHSEYAYILKCLAHCEEGVMRLKKGDKRVFKFDANGEFAMARRILSHYSQLLERIDIGENRIDGEHTPRWAEFREALIQLAKAWGECAKYILESRFTDEAAPVRYNEWLKELLHSRKYPPLLHEVPNPKDNIFVRTGELTPCSGIWEPIDAPKPSLIMLLLGKAEKPEPPFAIMGAMNYLHGGSLAPTTSAFIIDDSVDMDTTWRLLWRDDRYIDGSVPEEEKYYRFTQPDVKRSTQPTVAVNDQITWAESGAAAPKAGRWLVESDMATSVELKAGELLPLHQGRTVRWVLAE
ncbi:Imm71 family immunity protein [Herbaspirillum sp. GW103]|uniref:Imm71 family immunity protein n=1 Tax=Herbaspirillum sp. GW103 TaxID=1175306 RepID=UPI0005549678|nr:Imm71 family immunity protein [Herbaspirillum sp. GW103]